MNCLFCKIANGDIPSAKVYEDENFTAFLDINPVNKGHTLVVPKKHFETLLDIPEEILVRYMVVVKKISGIVKNAVGASGFNLMMNNFKASGQEVDHAHLHIIPRFENDGLKHWPGKNYEEGEMEQVKEKIKKAFGDIGSY